MTKRRMVTAVSGGAILLSVSTLAMVSKGCGDQSTATSTESVTSAIGQPSQNEVELDGSDIVPPEARALPQVLARTPHALVGLVRELLEDERAPDVLDRE